MIQTGYFLYVRAFALKNLIRDIFCPLRSSGNYKLITYPWLWIGAEIEPNNFISVTEVVNTKVKSGITVTCELLEEITGLKDVISWRYLDSKTLKEVDFPLTGIIIEE
jgi:hypothetical protein